MSESEVLQPERQLIGDQWHMVYVSKNRRFSVDTGPDDQRPDYDGEHFFRPVCVEEILFTEVYRYHFYCGFCEQRMECVKGYCPNCGRGIAHYVFAMGTRKHKRNLPGSMPDHLADIST